MDNFYIFKRIFQVGTTKHIYQPGERPPYPIIIERPLPRDVLANMKLPQWIPFLFSMPFGSISGYCLSKGIKEAPLLRRRIFTIILGYTMFVGFFFGYKGSYYKLRGFQDNGLVWKTPDRYQKKYNFTEDMKGKWFAQLIKRKDIDGSKVY